MARKGWPYDARRDASCHVYEQFSPILPSCYRGARLAHVVATADRAALVVTVVPVRALVAVVVVFAQVESVRPTTAMTAAHSSGLLLVLVVGLVLWAPAEVSYVPSPINCRRRRRSAAIALALTAGGVHRRSKSGRSSVTCARSAACCSTFVVQMNARAIDENRLEWDH
jgi:hypothetical protein